MPSKLTLRMLLAATLAALLLSASGAPLEDARTNCTADVEGSGEEQREEGVETRNQQESLDIIGKWKQAIALTERYKEEFDKEFQGTVKYISLEDYKHPSFPLNCPSSKFKKEACLQRLAEGLLTYMVLLKHVEKEYPNSSIVTGGRDSVPGLIQMIKSKMRGKRVKAMTSCEEQQLLKELDDPDAFTRKLRAHSILCYLRFFLIDGKRSFCSYETLRNQAACANTTN